MEYETLKTIDPSERDLALGKAYIELAAKGAGAQTAELIAALKARLRTGESEAEKEAKKAAFYDFLTELCCLTFLLYKWGLLLFHLKQGSFDNLLLTIVVGGERAIIVENRGALRLETLDSSKLLFEANGKKSALFALLLWLMDKQTALEIVSVSQDEPRFDGNHISFDAKRKAAQQDQIALLEAEFFRYKQRLDSLQKLFIDSFGRPSAMRD